MPGPLLASPGIGVQGPHVAAQQFSPQYVNLTTPNVSTALTSVLGTTLSVAGAGLVPGYGNLIAPSIATIVANARVLRRQRLVSHPRGRQVAAVLPPALPPTRRQQPKSGTLGPVVSRVRRTLPVPVPTSVVLVPQHRSTSTRLVVVVRRSRMVPVQDQSRVARASRARAILPIARRNARVVPTSQDTPVRRAPKRSQVGLQRGRASRWTPVQDVTLRVAQSTRSRLASVRRGRRVTPVPTQVVVIAPSWVPSRIAPRKMLSAVQRGKRTLPTPAQIVVPKLVPNRAPKLRRGFTVRGRRFNLPWPLSLLAPRVLLPTSLVLDAHSTGLVLDAHQGNVTLDAHQGNVALDAHATGGSLDAHSRATALDAHQTSLTLDPHQSNVTLDD